MTEDVVKVVTRTCRKVVRTIVEKAADVVQGSAAQSSVESVTASAAESVVDTATESVVEAAVDSVVEAAAESVVEAASESLVQAAAESVVEAAAASVMEAATESVMEAVADSVMDVASESMADAVAESMADAVAESMADAVAESMADAVAESMADAVAESMADAVAESMADAVTESMTEYVMEAAAESVVQAAAESVVEAAAESVVQVAAESVAEAAADSVAEAAAESIAEAVIEAASDSVVQAATEAVVESTTETVAEVAAETVMNVAKGGYDAKPATVLNMLGFKTMNYRAVYEMMAGKSLAENEFLEPYVATLIYFVIVISLGFLLRRVTKVIVPGNLQVYLLEFIATMEVCSYFYENSFVLKHYGYSGFFVAIVLEILISNRTLEGASENPIKALDEFSKREITFDKALLKIVFQCLGGLASYRIAQLVWSLDMIEDHHTRFYEVTCETDLVVTIALGFGIETGAALIDIYFGKQTLSTYPLVDEFIKAVTAGTMIAAGVSLTGMYYNPAMATGHMFGCKGTELWEHLLVYWAGPFTGCFLAIILDKHVHIENGKLV